MLKNVEEYELNLAVEAQLTINMIVKITSWVHGYSV